MAPHGVPLVPCFFVILDLVFVVDKPQICRVAGHLHLDAVYMRRDQLVEFLLRL
jgi:hypothetical protein